MSNISLIKQNPQSTTWELYSTDYETGSTYDSPRITPTTDKPFYVWVRVNTELQNDYRFPQNGQVFFKYTRLNSEITYQTFTFDEPDNTLRMRFTNDDFNSTLAEIAVWAEPIRYVRDTIPITAQLVNCSMQAVNIYPYNDGASTLIRLFTDTGYVFDNTEKPKFHYESSISEIDAEFSVSSDLITAEYTFNQSYIAYPGSEAILITGTAFESVEASYTSPTLYKLTNLEEIRLTNEIFVLDSGRNEDPVSNGIQIILGSHYQDCVLHKARYPFNVAASENNYNVYAFDKKLETSVPIVPNHTALLDFGLCNVKRILNNSADYYIDLSIYLPYIGVYPLQADKYVGNEVALTYKVYLPTGDTQATLEYDNIVLDAFAGNIGTQISNTPLANNIMPSQSNILLTGLPYFFASYNPLYNETNNIPISDNKRVNLSEIEGYCVVNDIMFNSILPKDIEDEIRNLLMQGVDFSTPTSNE